MVEKQTPDEFRASATKSYRFASKVLIAFVIIAGGIGWFFGGWLWLLIVGGSVGVLAFVVWFAITLLWVMTQDGG